MGSFVRAGAALFVMLLVSAAALAAASPSEALFPQCPPVDLDTGCQFLITVTDAGSSVAEDPTQKPYEGEDDALIGVQNSSSRAITALPLSATGLFSFEEDGMCDPGAGPVPAGCAPVPGGPLTSCTGGGGWDCSFPPPPGEPPNYTEPTATGGATSAPPWPNGDRQNGYEGPTSWFTVPSGQTTEGTVNFSPSIAPGATTYFSLESPPSVTAFKVGTPTSAPGGSGPKVPPAFGPNGVIRGLPNPKLCVSKRHFTIHIRRYKGITYLEALVFVDKKRNTVAKSRNGQFTSPINLRGLPKGTYVVKIEVVTSSGAIIVGKRTYHTCHKKITPRGHGRL